VHLDTRTSTSALERVHIGLRWWLDEGNASEAYQHIEEIFETEHLLASQARVEVDWAGAEDWRDTILYYRHREF